MKATKLFELDHAKYSVFIKVLKSISNDSNPCIIKNSVLTKISGTSIVKADLSSIIGDKKNFSIVGVKNLLSISRNIGNGFKTMTVSSDNDYYIFDFGKLIFRSYKNIYQTESLDIPVENRVEAKIGKLDIKPVSKNVRFMSSDGTVYAISFSDDIIYYLDESFKGLVDNPEIELISRDFMMVSDDVENMMIISDTEENIWLKTIYNIDGIIIEQFEPLTVRRENDVI